MLAEKDEAVQPQEAVVVPPGGDEEDSATESDDDDEDIPIPKAAASTVQPTGARSVSPPSSLPNAKASGSCAAIRD